jgi:hypothetical protein
MRPTASIYRRTAVPHQSGLASGTHHLRGLTAPPSETSTRHTRLLPVMGVRVVDAGCRDVVELLARAGLRLGDVDDFEDLGTAEAGDLHGTGAGEVRTCAGEGVGMCRQPLSPQHILKAEERMPRVPWP